MAVRDKRMSNEEGSGPNPDAPALPTAIPATICRRTPALPGSCLNRYGITHRGRTLAQGIAIGTGVITGTVCRATSLQEAGACPDNCVLVCSDTGPEWLPVLERANAVVTEHGTRTSHTAIACRELGIPAIVNAGEAIKRLRKGDPVTVSCADGDVGFVYEGFADIQISEINTDSIPITHTRIMLNLANPMLGWRGASRYYNAEFREAFALECQAIRTARDEIGMDNLRIMILFCRTPEEADKVLEELSANGLVRGERGLTVYMTAEVPANIEFAAFLVNCGIDFLPVSPDSFLRVKEQVAQAESAGAAP